MAIGKLPALGAASLGTASAVGGGYWALTRDSKTEVKEDLKSKYKLAILKEQADWDKKFEVLKKENTAPNYAPLKAAHDKRTSNESQAKALHRQACEGVYALPKDHTQNLEEFAKYCFFNNLDKKESSKNLISTNGDFQDKWSTFSAKQEKDLPSDLVEAFKGKGNSNGDSGWQQKMVSGCKKLSERIYEGESEDFKNFCLK
ncbi:hypothetical protein HF1_07530 [Mycoplasma haemofelis str. Langford 1]|uniref:Uncharacterized protein n=1 Tax=Mycoplasma haemofelis (strain Langford 1) TaxID=941640 RepID=E8ZHZ0_MYCHL|nr:hypothetical protein [Mycoplasma haemofelis]CBY92761.1 hypothetical protein HF1_07530 [Mycoplasma haemofelis str. Langford 1]